MPDRGAVKEAGCLICKAPLEYFPQDRPMECAICGKTQWSKARCVNGHFVCDDCHTQGVDQMLAVCLSETSRDPVRILEQMMAMSVCHMHGPEHHSMVGMALLTAYQNAGGDLEISDALQEMLRRGKAVPGGACGFWGACGAGISAGQFLAIVTGSTPLAEEPWGLSNRMSAKALETIGRHGGPRCCKRNSYLAILAAVDFAREYLQVQMQPSPPVCTRSHWNPQCIAEKCPFYGGDQ